MSGREHLGGRSAVGGFFVVVVILAALLAIARFASLTGSEPRPGATSDLGELADPEATYDPVRAGERLPDGYRQLLRRDAILPVYDPQFLAGAQNATWPDDTLVIGLALDGEAKAYPVSWLNRREMVVDRIAGIPILVTW